jgi:hypothetical protein
MNSEIKKPIAEGIDNEPCTKTVNPDDDTSSGIEMQADYLHEGTARLLADVMKAPVVIGAFEFGRSIINALESQKIAHHIDFHTNADGVTIIAYFDGGLGFINCGPIYKSHYRPLGSPGICFCTRKNVMADIRPMVDYGTIVCAECGEGLNEV